MPSNDVVGEPSESKCFCTFISSLDSTDPFLVCVSVTSSIRFRPHRGEIAAAGPPSTNQSAKAGRSHSHRLSPCPWARLISEPRAHQVKQSYPALLSSPFDPGSFQTRLLSPRSLAPMPLPSSVARSMDSTPCPSKSLAGP